MHQCDFQNFCGALGLQPGPRERVAQRGTRDVSAIAQEVIETRSQRNTQIFRRLLKLAVRGMHECDCLNFCGGSPWAPTWPSRARLGETILGLTTRARLLALGHDCAYLLGLLAMIKCSICSYQCDNWYVSNWRLACHIYFSVGRCPLELAQGLSRVAPILHFFGRSAPFGVTFALMAGHFGLPPCDAGNLLKGASPPPSLPSPRGAHTAQPRRPHGSARLPRDCRLATPVTCSRARRPSPSPLPPPPHHHSRIGSARRDAGSLPSAPPPRRRRSAAQRGRWGCNRPLREPGSPSRPRPGEDIIPNGLARISSRAAWRGSPQSGLARISSRAAW